MPLGICEKPTEVKEMKQIIFKTSLPFFSPHYLEKKMLQQFMHLKLFWVSYSLLYLICIKKIDKHSTRQKKCVGVEIKF